MSRERALKLSDSIRAFSQPQQWYAGFHYCPYTPVIPTHTKADEAAQSFADQIRNEIDNEIVNRIIELATAGVPFPKLDLVKLTHGIPVGELSVMMAQSNCGKSMFWREQDDS